MIYLSGHIATAHLIPNGGLMKTEQVGGTTVPHGLAWAADNGCFAHPERFDFERYRAWLAALTPYRETCLFAVVPDVPGDGAATLARFRQYADAMRPLGYPLALAAQNGMEDMELPWDDFDVYFQGGIEPWKFSEVAYELSDEAKRRGKWLHMGRVNSYRRLAAARHAGYDSADGTFVVFAPDFNVKRVQRWMRRLHEQPPLAAEGAHDAARDAGTGGS